MLCPLSSSFKKIENFSIDSQIKNKKFQSSCKKTLLDIGLSFQSLL